MNAIPATKITRSMVATVGYFASGLVAIALCVWLCKVMARGTISTGIALIPGLVGVVLVGLAFVAAGTGTCPACGAEVGGLSTTDNDGVHCEKCRAYLEGKNGELQKTDENRVAATPIFATSLPEKFEFPAVCCVCRGPETRREKVSLTTKDASSALTESTLGVSSTTKTSVEVPHCAQHKGGAMLAGTAPNTRIRFRSYPYLRAFCQQNGTTPG